MPNIVAGRQDLIMDATWEDGTINSGDPEINADPPLEERIYISDIARKSEFSLAHQEHDSIRRNQILISFQENAHDQITNLKQIL